MESVCIASHLFLLLVCTVVCMYVFSTDKVVYCIQ